jgi:hypothetical protein
MKVSSVGWPTVFLTRHAVKLMALIFCACAAAKPQSRTPEITAVSFDEPLGLSDLALAPDKTLWSVAEDARVLVRLDPSARQVRSFPLENVPKGLDLEALAWLDADTVVIGTEGDEPGRKSDLLLIAKRSNDRFVVTTEHKFSYKPWKLEAPKNKGVEALCTVEGFFLAGSELRDKGTAPLALYTTDGNVQSTAALHLTSKDGKLSALACQRQGDAIEFYAIERHFGVSLLLHAYLPLVGGDVVPNLVLDLGQQIENIPNLEGLAWQGDKLWLISDNQYGTRQGPTWLFSLTKPRE